MTGTLSFATQEENGEMNLENKTFGACEDKDRISFKLPFACGFLFKRFSLVDGNASFY